MSIQVGFKSAAKARAVQQVVAEAMRTNDLKGAVAKQANLLTLQEREVLQSLSSAELKALASVDAKLSPLGLSSLY
jgi:hypothetical protein